MSGPSRSRPTSELAVVALDSLDSMVAQLFERLDGLSDDEYLWEPVGGMWSVRRRGDVTLVGGAGERDIDPAPVTTIAWRLWHLALDCLDDYTRRLAGDTADADAEWTLVADEAMASLERCWTSFRAAMSARTDWWQHLGPDWGPWHEHHVIDLALHAGNESVHHGAEIALLRDLFRANGSGAVGG